MRERFKEKEIAEIEKYLIKLGFKLEQEFELVDENNSLIKEASFYSIKNPETGEYFEITVFKGKASNIYINWWKIKENYCVQNRIRITHDSSKTKELIKKEVEEWKK